MSDPQFIPADMNGQQLGSGVDPASDALMSALSQIRAIQQQPLIPTDPFSQLGAGLSGIAAGYRGDVNPAIKQGLAIRGQQLQGSVDQAHLGLGMAHLGMQQQMEQRRLQQERETEQFRRQNEVFKTQGMLTQSLFKLGESNPLYAEKGMQSMEQMYKQANIPPPPGGFSIDGMRDLATQSKKVVTYLLAAPNTDDASIAAATGVTLAAVSQMRSTIATSGPGRDALTKSLFGWTYDELAADTEKLKTAKVDLQKKQVDANVSLRLYQLEAMPTRSPAQDAERIMLQGFGKVGNDERDMVAAILKNEGLSLDLAIPKAARIMAEAKKQGAPFDDVVKAIMQKNPGMDKGTAVLQADAQTKAAKTDFTTLETQLDTMKDFLTRLDQVSSQVNTSGSGLMQVPKTVIRYGTSFVRADEALTSLQRKQGELANVMRFLGEKGVISDRDIVRGQLLLPSIWTSGPVAKSSIEELRSIVRAAESNLAKRKAGALTISGPPDASNPLRITR